MQHINLSLALVLLVALVGCGRDKQLNEELVFFDVSKNYPEKEIYIQDIGEVEYVTLEVNDEFLYSYILGISDNYIICGNHVDKSFLFFSRTTGKPISKINAYGNGPEEYNLTAASVYSEEKDEFFILDYPIGIKVYGRDGSFKRELEFRQGSYIGGPEAFYDYDENNLMFYDGFQGTLNEYPTSFVLISKQDGHTTKEIEIPYEKKISLMFTRKSDGSAIVGSMPKVFFAVRNENDFLLTDYSTDTVYRFTPEHNLIPVLVREPSIQEMNSKIILHSWLETADYLFLTTNKLEIEWDNPGEFKEQGYLIEKKTGSIYQSRVLIKDYKGKEIILGLSVLSRSLQDTQIGYISFPSYELIDANKENRINGELKEIVDQLTDDDGYVIMIMKFKNKRNETH